MKMRRHRMLKHRSYRQCADGFFAWQYSPDGPLYRVHIDIERMERALAGPFYTVPHGLSAEEFDAFIAAVNAGEIAPAPHCRSLPLGEETK
jgi:hypothetical protein